MFQSIEKIFSKKVNFYFVGLLLFLIFASENDTWKHIFRDWNQLQK